MKIYTIHSPSHQKYFDLFKGSLNGRHEIISREVEQISSPDYGAGDIINIYRLMVLYILEALYKETEPFLFMGVDIYFFKDFDIDLGDKDMLVTYEKHVYGLPTICTGVMCLRPNKRTRKMFLWILKHFDKLRDDQRGVNIYLYTHPFSIKWGLLPKEYYSINYDNGNKIWNGEQIKLSVDPILLHYHWTLGDENRMKLLKMVKEQV